MRRTELPSGNCKHSRDRYEHTVECEEKGQTEGVFVLRKLQVFAQSKQISVPDVGTIQEGQEV
jgi:hypothetical protein